jgi:hypothetical protein
MGTISADYVSQDILDQLCDHIAEGNSVHGFFRDVVTNLKRNWFHVWMKNHATDDQRTQYERACEDRQDSLFEQCLEIADDSSLDTKTIKRRDGREMDVCDKEWVARSKLRVESRVRMLGKMNPKKYGERLNTAISDPDGKALTVPLVQVYLPDNGRDAPEGD